MASNLKPNELRVALQAGLYQPHQIGAMIVQYTNFPTKKSLEKLEIIKQHLGDTYMSTRQELILKGLIKPAETRPTLTLNKQEDVGEVSIPSNKEITDADIAQKYLSLRSSANRRGKEFNLSLSDVRTLLKKKTCYYTGLPFTDEVNYSRTVDRIDANKGYVKGNVVACTHIANQLKEMLVENKEAPFRTNVKALKKFIEKL